MKVATDQFADCNKQMQDERADIQVACVLMLTNKNLKVDHFPKI